MSINGSQPIPVVQMGLVEKIAEVAQNHPEVQQSMLQEHFGKEVARQSEQVTSVVKEDETNALKSNKDKEKNPTAEDSHDQQHNHLKKGVVNRQASRSEGEALFGDSFVGNIFNGKA